jgi:tetratricopeptide (TPR) repeat protein
VAGVKAQELKLTSSEVNTMEATRNVVSAYRASAETLGSKPLPLAELLQKQCECVANYIADKKKNVNSPTTDSLARSAGKSCMASIASDSDKYSDAGDKFADAKEYEKAIGSYSKSLATRPTNAYVLWRRAMTYDKIKKYDLALADLTHAIEINPDNPSNYTWRGVIYSEQGEREKAMADFSQSIKLKDDDFTYLRRGEAYANDDEYDKAIADYDRALAVNPKYASAYFQRGRVHSQTGEYEKAISDYSQDLTIDPKDADAYSGRAFALAGIGKNNEAIRDFDKIIAMDPKNAWAYGNRAWLNFILGKSETALPDFEKATKIEPTNAYYLLWLDIANRSANHPSQLSKSQKAIDMTVWPAPLVKLYLNQTTFEAVLESAKDSDANKSRGQLCEAQFYGGKWKLFTGAKDDAIKLYRLASEGCPLDYIERVWAGVELKALGIAL